MESAVEKNTVRKRDQVFSSVQSLICVRLFATPWTVGCQAPLSMEFSTQEYWSGLPFPTPGDLPDPGIELESLSSPVLAGRFFTASLDDTVQSHPDSVISDSG